jgi:hypothetical protein
MPMQRTVICKKCRELFVIQPRDNDDPVRDTCNMCEVLSLLERIRQAVSTLKGKR